MEINFCWNSFLFEQNIFPWEKLLNKLVAYSLNIADVPIVRHVYKLHKKC